MQFNRIIVILNPKSTHARAAGRRIAELEKLVPKGQFTLVETSSEGRAANRKLLKNLAAKLGPRTLLCVAAGDGTVNMVVDTLLTDQSLPAAARQTPVLPLWGGNANDLAHMLNGSAWRSDIRQILTKGRVIAIRPLRCTLTLPDGTIRTHLAACYASFGASAFAAHRLSHPAKRQHHLDKLPGGRVMKELGTVIKALMDAPQTNTLEAGQTHKFYEHIFVNGSRFAKVRGVRLDLTAGHFYHTVMRRKRARSLFFHMWELTNPRAGQRVAGDHAEFTLLGATWAQFDGEVFELPASTHVEVALGPQPFYALATKLAPAAKL